MYFCLIYSILVLPCNTQLEKNPGPTILIFQSDTILFSVVNIVYVGINTSQVSTYTSF